jgi:hypothetical protein
VDIVFKDVMKTYESARGTIWFEYAEAFEVTDEIINLINLCENM